MFAPWIDSSFVIDIETSGLDTMRNEILSLSVSIVENESGNELDSELFLFKPVQKKFWNEESERIHGISWAQSQNFENPKTEWLRFLRFLRVYASRPQMMVCHALWFGKYFDSAFIDCQLDMQGLLYEKRKFIYKTCSTMAMAKNLSKKGLLNAQSFGLAELCRVYEIPLEHHNAVSDRKACQELFFKFLKLGAIDENTDYDYLPPTIPQKGADSDGTKGIKKGNGKRGDKSSLL